MGTKKSIQEPLSTDNAWKGVSPFTTKGASPYTTKESIAPIEASITPTELSPSTINFIQCHRNEDVHALALKSVNDATIDLKAALEQIAGWQKARIKLPVWAETDGIIYPPHISMEQCSSQQTAEYKAKIAYRLTNGNDSAVQRTLVDLTGGFGVDFSYMVRRFSRGIYVELQERLCQIAQHNFRVLGLSDVEVKNTSAEHCLDGLGESSLIFIDPARRNLAGNRTYAISDCTPNVLAMKDALLRHSPVVMIKLSPMLDWRKAVSDFQGAVSEVHIVAVDNECKELLLILRRETTTSVKVFCVNDNDVLEFTDGDFTRQNTNAQMQQSTSNHMANAYKYLSEPNVAVMKAGCFRLIEQRFSVMRIGLNSNLFVSDKLPEGFPGRVFVVETVSSMRKNELKQLLSGISRANITTRNFPLSVAELRKRLKLKDGGDCYLFATTDHSGRHLILKCKKP